MALNVSLDEIVARGHPLLATKPSWRRVRLGDIGQVLNGFAFKSTLFSRDRGVPLVRIRDVGRDASDTFYSGEFDERYLIETGDLLIGMDGDFNCARWRGPRALLNQRVCKVSVDPTKYVPRLLDYVLPGYLRAINEATSSITVKHLSSRTVEDIPLPLPPREEQHAIIAELEKQFSRLDEAVTDLQRVRANIKRYKKSVLRAAVEGRIGSTAGGWKDVRLGDVALSVRNGYSQKPDAESGTRILRISAVRPMELAADDVRYLSGEPADYDSFLAVEGDVLFTRYNGSRDYVGVCAVVPPGMPPTVYPDKLIRVRLPQSMLLPEFLAIAASTGKARQFIESVIRTTAGQSGVSGADIKTIPLSIPPVSEQRQIVAEVDRRLSIVRELEAEVDTNLKRSRTLRQAILAQAFSGGPA